MATRKLVLAFALFLAPTCARTESPANLKAREIWLANQRVVETAGRGKRVDLKQFRDATKFFGELASIRVPGEHSPMIYWYPTHETSKVIEPLRRWYQANGGRLYWDPTADKIEMGAFSGRLRASGGRYTNDTGAETPECAWVLTSTGPSPICRAPSLRRPDVCFRISIRPFCRARLRQTRY